VPCGIIRGISNAAGDRDHVRWQTAAALRAAAELALQVMAGAS
jgi:futalosine hydrolase